MLVGTAVSVGNGVLVGGGVSVGTGVCVGGCVFVGTAVGVSVGSGVLVGNGVSVGTDVLVGATVGTTGIGVGVGCAHATNRSTSTTMDSFLMMRLSPSFPLHSTAAAIPSGGIPSFPRGDLNWSGGPPDLGDLFPSRPAGFLHFHPDEEYWLSLGQSGFPARQRDCCTFAWQPRLRFRRWRSEQ